jgi:hypothetical protein
MAPIIRPRGSAAGTRQAAFHENCSGIFGGLDTSVLLSWIKEKYNAEMIAFCADIGQEEELDGLEAKRPKPARPKSTSTICRRNSRATSSTR